MPKIAVIPDVHLGEATQLGRVSPGTNINSCIIDQINLLDFCLEQSIERGVKYLIFTGDIFDEPKPPITIITLFSAFLKKCTDNGMIVHIVAGNHDILRIGETYISALNIFAEMELENIFIHNQIETAFIETTSLTFVPFRDRKSFALSSNTEAILLMEELINYEISSIPQSYKKICIGHMALEGSIPALNEIDDIANELFCPLSMFSLFDITIQGHIHKPQILKKHPYIGHIGSLFISDYGEADQRKYFLIIDDNIEEIDLPVRKLKEIDIIVPVGTDNSTEYVLSQINNVPIDKSIVRVSISLSSPDLVPVNKVDIEKHLFARGAFNVSSISQTKKSNIVKNEKNKSINQKMDVASSIKMWANNFIDESERSQFIELALDIFNELKSKEK
jgi:DNA repair exonuclease SbcCD nuclease subunit